MKLPIFQEDLNTELIPTSSPQKGEYYFFVPEYKTNTFSTNEGLHIISFYAVDKTEIDKTEEEFKLTLASESALKKDWNKPEEDEAWANL